MGTGAGTDGTETRGVKVGGGVTDGTEAWAAVQVALNVLRNRGGGGRGQCSSHCLSGAGGIHRGLVRVLIWSHG
jgi:hypothetical protein